MASKSKSRRRVFRASCILAALIVAGSSFAWFTSKDEVTNRLSASANYGVAIAEDFQPPENWIPGQAVNKDVAAVNTGNIDAFARMWVEGEMSVVARTSQDDSAPAIPGEGASLTKISPVTDTKYTSINLNYMDDNGRYYRELSQAKVKNPELNDSGDANENGVSENTPATFSEVQAMQAGAYLAGAPANAQFYYVVEHACKLDAYTDKLHDSIQVVELKEGDIIATKGASLPTGTPADGQTVVYIDAVAGGTTGLNIDSSQFYPQTEGNYIFRRNVGLTKTTGEGAANGVNEKDDYEYSGYYYVPKGGTALLKTEDSTADHYIALYTSTDAGSDRSDYTIPDNSVTETTVLPSQDVVTVAPTANLKFYNAKEKVVQNSDLKWVYTAPVAADPEHSVVAQPGKLTAYYDGGDNTVGYSRAGSDTEADPYVYTDMSANDIAVEITLANIGTSAQEWTAINGNGTSATWYTDSIGTSQSVTTGQNTTFYYNDDIKAGDTATILIDSVKLADATKKDAYLAFDFDLNVKLESVQVTVDEDGKEKTTPVNSWAATAGENNTGAKPSGGDNAATYDTANSLPNEILTVGWTDIT